MNNLYRALVSMPDAKELWINSDDINKFINIVPESVSIKTSNYVSRGEFYLLEKSIEEHIEDYFKNLKVQFYD
ncbi:MAG TPA: hypothetical protein VEA37_05400 [Flavobacterium sp.]|nr:hypothetical protein [Flavobacterium sp.]